MITFWNVRVAEVDSLSARAKMGHTNSRLVRIRYFRDKYVVFARNYKLANMI